MKALLLAAASCFAMGTAYAAGPVVQTSYGPVQGISNGVVNSFLGIPYAMPPVGSLRWMPPMPPAAHQSTLPATQYSAYCPQGESEIGFGGGSEDCLYLNVQTPASATSSSNLPVMVWIHGGGLTTGSGQEYDGSALVQDGVVFVSFNYRLGLLGFLAHPALAAENKQGTSGNYGLQDQQAAIAWVRQNAAAFGGNPGNITIFGESAGGQSVIDQLTSPGLGKIRSAVIESGAYARLLPTQTQAQASGVNIASALGCSDQTAACLRTVSAQDLVNLVGAGVVSTSGVNITPNVDGDVLPMQPFHAFYTGQFAHVPVIDGTNHDEYRLFVAENDLLGSGPLTAAEYTATVQAMSGKFASAVLAEYPVSNYPSPDYALAAVATDYAFSCGAVLLDALIVPYAPVYAYELTDANVPDIFLPFDPNLPSLGDSHAAELPYLFPHFRNAALGLGPANFSPAQLQLASTMRADWTSLARYGRPLSPLGGIWPHYTLAAHGVLSLFSPSPQTETDLIGEHNCDFWLPFLLKQAKLPSTVPY